MLFIACTVKMSSKRHLSMLTPFNLIAFPNIFEGSDTKEQEEQEEHKKAKTEKKEGEGKVFPPNYCLTASDKHVQEGDSDTEHEARENYLVEEDLIDEEHVDHGANKKGRNHHTQEGIEVDGRRVCMHTCKACVTML